ncbi:DUF4434 domain-containing protein [Clostridium sp. JN-1]|uniref:DUF4434 domain-containing protein n=1 Tax=Clostridium sp. JN-1 TaxID=2483110 RepID=UPI000F0B0423|nr:DUF4434 domain-containing protein [Clostridium sp. JN-1]
MKQELLNNDYPKASGTFIQPDMVMNWDDSRWQKELSYLKEVKMEYLIMNTFIVKDKKIRRIYKTSIKDEERIGIHDVVNKCLKNSKKYGFKVFLGIDYNDKWWKYGPRNPKWLYMQMHNGNLAIQELYEKYYGKYKNTFCGWYWVYEVDNLNFKNYDDFKVLANAVNINLNYMDANGMRLPLMISPFMNSRYSTPQAYAENWKCFFENANLKKRDIFCPQDSVGGGGLNISEVKDWFNALSKAVKSNDKVLFWANTETFDHTNWSSAPIKRFIQQMNIEIPFVSNIITFSYSHYYSPNNINHGFHRAYKEYLYKHIISNVKPDPPKWMKVTNLNYNKILIEWEVNKNLAGYKIFCAELEIASMCVQRKYGGNNKEVMGKLICKCNCKKSIYKIRSFDFWGNLSDVLIVNNIK